MIELLPLAQQVAHVRGWDNQLRVLMQLGSVHPSIDEKLKCDRHLVTGCDTQVWLVAPSFNTKKKWMGDASSRMVKGMLAILLEYSNEESTPKLLKDYLNYVEKAGLSSYLSASRRQGMHKLIERLSLD